MSWSSTCSSSWVWAGRRCTRASPWAQSSLCCSRVRCLPRSWDARPCTRGLSIAVLGLLLLWWSVAYWDTDITVRKLAPALLLTGFGAGLIFVPLFDVILGDATTAEVGTGAGMLNTVQQCAGAIGVAALGHRPTSTALDGQQRAHEERVQEDGEGDSEAELPGSEKNEPLVAALIALGLCLAGAVMAIRATERLLRGVVSLASAPRPPGKR